MRHAIAVVLVLVALVAGVAGAPPDPFNTEKLDGELRGAGLPIEGCDATGRIAWRASATASDRERGAAIVAAHDPLPTRAQRLRRAGLGLDALLALRATPTEWARLTVEERAWVDARLEPVAVRARAALAGGP